MEYRALDQSKGEVRFLTLWESEGAASPSATAADYHQPGSLSALPSTRAGNQHLVDDIHCKLEHYPLQAYSRTVFDSADETMSSRYIALSYMWGDERDLSTIYVNGQPVQVRRNLKMALDAP